MASTSSSSLASFSASLPPYLVLASSHPPTSFQTVVDRSQTLWNSLEECEAAVVAGGERVKALREALLAGLKDAVLEIAVRVALFPPLTLLWVKLKRGSIGLHRQESMARERRTLGST
jgi:hypothetical protein